MIVLTLHFEHFSMHRKVILANSSLLAPNIAFYFGIPGQQLSTSPVFQVRFVSKPVVSCN